MVHTLSLSLSAKNHSLQSELGYCSCHTTTTTTSSPCSVTAVAKTPPVPVFAAVLSELSDFKENGL
jgi:hypothetical protein